MISDLLFGLVVCWLFLVLVNIDCYSICVCCSTITMAQYINFMNLATQSFVTEAEYFSGFIFYRRNAANHSFFRLLELIFYSLFSSSKMPFYLIIIIHVVSKLVISLWSFRNFIDQHERCNLFATFEIFMKIIYLTYFPLFTVD